MSATVLSDDRLTDILPGDEWWQSALTLAMDTVVRIELVGSTVELREAALREALGWFHHVEAACSRFDPTSELRRLCARPGEAVQTSPVLFEATAVALAVAEASSGAFDPTLGAALEAAGFDTEYRSGKVFPSGVAVSPASFRDLRLDRQRQTITLLRPLLLDLGAVAKGLAIDLATQALRGRFAGFAINAGGDLSVGGDDGNEAGWSVGVRDPANPACLSDTLRLSDVAICTSGGYERPTPRGSGEHHIIDPRSGASPAGTASVTVIGPSAALADALATAAFVLGPPAGINLVTSADAAALIVQQDGTRHLSPGFQELLR